MATPSLLRAMNGPTASYHDVRAGTAPIAIDFNSQSDSLVVTFGGMAEAREMPIFEFFASASQLDIHKIFVRDLRRTWYHRGLPGIGENIDEVAAYLDRVIQQQKFKHLTFIGSSTGGYAAILFGCLLNVNTVVAFVPKTFLHPWKRLLCLDVKPWARLWTLLWSKDTQREYFDLRRVLESRATTTKFHVHFSADGGADVVHAEHLRGCANVFLHPHPKGGHKLVKKLRDSGELNEILVASVPHLVR